MAQIDVVLFVGEGQIGTGVWDTNRNTLVRVKITNPTPTKKVIVKTPAGKFIGESALGSPT